MTWSYNYGVFFVLKAACFFFSAQVKWQMSFLTLQPGLRARAAYQASWRAFHKLFRVSASRAHWKSDPPLLWVMSSVETHTRNIFHVTAWMFGPEWPVLIHVFIWIKHCLNSLVCGFSLVWAAYSILVMCNSSQIRKTRDTSVTSVISSKKCV